MRICYIADGQSVHFHRWMEYFTARGHLLHFVSYKPVTPSHIEAIERRGAVYRGDLGPFHLKRFWRTARSLRWLKGLLKSDGIDVLHCHFLSSNAWYAALSGFHPFVLTVMGGDLSGPGWRPHGLAEKVFTPRALGQADLVTTWSQFLAHQVRPFCRNRTPIEVIHGGVELSRFQPAGDPGYLRSRWSLPDNARIVFSPRLMRPLYNTHQIARAAETVCAADPLAYFLFANPEFGKDAAYEARVRALIGIEGVAERTRFLGAIPVAEMADYYRLADVTVSIPALDGTPMSVLESMACGTPVVVGALPDYDPQYIEPGVTVLGVDPGDPAAIAGAILQLIGDRALVGALTAEALRRVEATGGYEYQMSRMETQYRRVLNRDRSAIPLPA